MPLLPSEQRLRHPLSIVFTASFCLMVIELVAGRIMAPTLGVSLYTWTSIIGVILTGITIGNYVGGQLADRTPSRIVLGATFLVSAVGVTLIPYLAEAMKRLFANGSTILILSTLQYSLVVFFAPAFFLSFITPMVVKLQLEDLKTTGSTVGRIYAASAFGSIIGTFATGYFFIDLIGTRLIVLAVAMALMIMGLMIIADRKFFANRFMLLFLLLAVGSLALPRQCDRESNYYCIRIIPTKEANAQEGSILKLDHLTHSFVFPDREHGVKSLGYGYEKIYAQLAAMEYAPDKAFSAFFIGGGGFVIPRYFEAHYPESALDVAEIDPEVIAANYENLNLSPNTRISALATDARMALKNMPTDKQYDFMFADAFNDLSVPYHLTTKEFAGVARTHLTENGSYAANIIDDPRYGRFLASIIKTFQAVFPFVYLAPLKPSWKEPGRNTVVVIGRNMPMDSEKWLITKLPYDIDRMNSLPDGERKALLTIVRQEEMSAFVREKKGIVLTDDYVPVDTMIAPVFSRAY